MAAPLSPDRHPSPMEPALLRVPPGRAFRHPLRCGAPLRGSPVPSAAVGLEPRARDRRPERPPEARKDGLPHPSGPAIFKGFLWIF